LDISACEKELVKENLLRSFLQHRPMLAEARQDGAFEIVFHFTKPGGLELSPSKEAKAFGGSPLRDIDTTTAAPNR
jgi:hypothetical protein